MNGMVAEGPCAAKPERQEGERVPNKLILCFDGTDDTFKGNSSDSNVVKLYRKFDRNDDRQYHYYQRECLSAPELCGTSY